MVKARTWISLFIMAVATIAATASCGSDEGTGGGAAGGGVLGDGGNAGRTSVGRAGAAGTGGGSSSLMSKLGAPCTTAAQCDTGMVCLPASGTDFTGGGPPGGMCTLPCSGLDTDCTAVQAGSACFNLGTTAAPALYCLEGCTLGGDATSAAGKCQGRDDFACYDTSSTTVPDPYCIPLCLADVDCGPGLFCNKNSGVCSKTKVTGDPVGTACSPSATNNTCDGFCIRTSADNVTPVTGQCAEFCAGLLGCQYNAAKTQAGGVCYGAFSDGFGYDDLGYCLPSCDCTGECPFPGDMCRAWTAAQQGFVDQLHKAGLCVPDLAGSTELTTCANGEGGAGGALGTGSGEAGASGAMSVEPGEGGSSGSPN